MSIILPGTYYYSNMIGFKIEQEGRLIIYIYIYIYQVADGVIRQNQCHLIIRKYKKLGRANL